MMEVSQHVESYLMLMVGSQVMVVVGYMIRMPMHEGLMMKPAL